MADTNQVIKGSDGKYYRVEADGTYTPVNNQQGYGYPPQGGSSQQGYGYPPQGGSQQGYGYPPQSGSNQQGYGYPPQGGNNQQGYGYPPQGGSSQQGYGYPPYGPNKPPRPGVPKKDNSNIFIWIIVGLCVLIGGGLGFYFGTRPSSSPTTAKSLSSKVVDKRDKDTDSEKPKKAETYRASAQEQEAFKRDGKFYGTMAGKAIHGYMNFESGSPEGWYYYDKHGSSRKLQLYQSGYNSWDEYSSGEYTGTWNISHTDFSKKNFMRGTFSRAKDGKTFKFSLKKQNFD